MIVLEDYWSPGKIIDTYYDVLTQKDVEYIESIANNAGKATKDSMDNIDDRAGFIPNPYIQGEDGEFSAEDLFPTEAEESSLLPYDVAGNVRVIKVFWKSRRKIKKVKSFKERTIDDIVQSVDAFKLPTNFKSYSKVSFEDSITLYGNKFIGYICSKLYFCNLVNY